MDVFMLCISFVKAFPRIVQRCGKTSIDREGTAASRLDGL